MLCIALDWCGLLWFRIRVGMEFIKCMGIDWCGLVWICMDCMDGMDCMDWYEFYGCFFLVRYRNFIANDQIRFSQF